MDAELRDGYSVKNLKTKVETLSVVSQVAKLDDFLGSIKFSGFITEWGAAKGRFSRLIPAIAASSFEVDCLWILDEEESEEIYPPAWQDIGFDLSRVHFLKSKDSFRDLKVAFNDDVFKLIVFDSHKFLNKGDLNFISQSVRSRSTAFFLIRHFFLTNRNGNPFSRSRFNTSFDLKGGRFNINTIKGRTNRRLSLKLDEVFSG